MRMHYKRRSGAVAAAILLLTLLACTFGVGEMTISLGPPSPTPTLTRTPRPTITPIPTATDTPTPTNTATPLATATATRRPPTPRPPTPRPPTAGPPQPTSPPAQSSFEFHVNPPSCSHAGQTYIKGTVYLNKNDPSQRYAGAVVNLGPPNASTVYQTILSEYDGVYTFVLGDNGVAHPGNWGVWLSYPDGKRKSDIGTINTNDLGADNANSCWAGTVDFWK